MIQHYTVDCSESCNLVLRPVPGANQWPRRIICERHGYPGEKRSKFVTNPTDPETPNDYLHEIAPPAELIQNGDGDIVSSQY